MDVNLSFWLQCLQNMYKQIKKCVKMNHFSQIFLEYFGGSYGPRIPTQDALRFGNDITETPLLSDRKYWKIDNVVFFENVA